MFYGDLFMKKYLINYIRENFKIFKAISVFIIIGIIIGIFLFNFLPNDIIDNIISSSKATLNLAKENNFEKTNIILNGTINNLILLSIIYISSLLIIAEQTSLLISTVKGLSIGFYAVNLINIFGIKNGIISILCLIIVPNIIYLPTFIFTLINSINFHYITVREKFNISYLIKEVYNLIISISLIFLSVILEQTMCNIVINLWKNM